MNNIDIVYDLFCYYDPYNMSLEHKNRMIEINRMTKVVMVKSTLFLRFNLSFEIYKFKKAVWKELPEWIKKIVDKPIFKPYKDMLQKVLK